MTITDVEDNCTAKFVSENVLKLVKEENNNYIISQTNDCISEQ